MLFRPLSHEGYTNEDIRKKNVKAHNYGQWIGVEKDLSVIEPHTIYFITIFEQFKGEWNYCTR